MSDLHEFLDDTTALFRKGEEVTERDHGNVHVVEVFAMPHESDADVELHMHDVEFMKIGVHPKKAEEHRDDLQRWCEEYPEPERLAGGPSYIELGAICGSQDQAFRVMALGAELGFWDLITPRTLHIEDDDEARDLAGKGFVMISGWKGAKVDASA